MPKWNSGLPIRQPRLVQLGRPGGPAELVVAVSPDTTRNQNGDGDVRQHAPEQGAHVDTPLVGARAYGSSPTVSVGGPAWASRCAAARSWGRRAGQQSTDRFDDVGIGRASIAQRQPEQLDTGPVLLQQGEPVGQVTGGGVLQYHRQIVRKLAGPELEPAAAVALLEQGERLSPPPGLPVGPPGQVKAAPAPAVERRDVVLGEFAGGGAREVLEKPDSAVRGRPCGRAATAVVTTGTRSRTVSPGYCSRTDAAWQTTTASCPRVTNDPRIAEETTRPARPCRPS